jgi:hypothetical protein
MSKRNIRNRKNVGRKSGSNVRQGSVSRRRFLGTAAAGVGAAAVGLGKVAHAATIPVGPGGYDNTIQTAINNANPGDTLVLSGTFDFGANGQVEINKPLTLRGPATIEGGRDSLRVDTNSGKVEIDGLTMEGFDNSAIRVITSDDLRISNNTLHKPLSRVFIPPSGPPPFPPESVPPQLRSMYIVLVDEGRLNMPKPLPGQPPVVPGSVTGKLEIEYNTIDGETYKIGHGHGIHCMGTKANVVICNNEILNTSFQGMAIFDCFNSYMIMNNIIKPGAIPMHGADPRRNSPTLPWGCGMIFVNSRYRMMKLWYRAGYLPSDTSYQFEENSNAVATIIGNTWEITSHQGWCIHCVSFNEGHWDNLDNQGNDAPFEDGIQPAHQVLNNDITYTKTQTYPAGHPNEGEFLPYLEHAALPIYFAASNVNCSHNTVRGDDMYRGLIIKCPFNQRSLKNNSIINNDFSGLHLAEHNGTTAGAHVFFEGTMDFEGDEADFYSSGGLSRAVNNTLVNGPNGGTYPNPTGGADLPLVTDVDEFDPDVEAQFEGKGFASSWLPDGVEGPAYYRRDWSNNWFDGTDPGLPDNPDPDNYHLQTMWRLVIGPFAGGTPPPPIGEHPTPWDPLPKPPVLLDEDDNPVVELKNNTIVGFEHNNIVVKTINPNREFECEDVAKGDWDGPNNTCQCPDGQFIHPILKRCVPIPPP